MSRLIELGFDMQPIDPVLVLSSRGGHKYGAIENAQSIVTTHPINDVAELSFDVYKEVNGVKCENWDNIKNFKFIQMPYDNSWFEAEVSIDEENDTIKHVTCLHANEAELSQLNLYETEINTENDIARDDYVETVFYDENNPNASLLNRVLADKAPHYQIYHVDQTLCNLFRTFSFDGVSVHDALNEIAEEVGCLFVYGEWSENDGLYHRTISAYDLEDYCPDCGKRGIYSDGVCTNCGSTNVVSGYGEDTGIFVSTDNLTDSIDYSTNKGDVKNCFRLVAGDDVMTAAVKACNPSMSQYLWYFSDDMLEDMSSGLRTKLTNYEALVSAYKDTTEINVPESAITQYNSIVQTYSEYNSDLVEIEYPIAGTTGLTSAYYNALNLYGYLKSEMMPASEEVTTTTALEQMDILLTGTNMSEVGIPTVSGTIGYTTANTAIQSYAKVYIDTSRYKVSAYTNNIVENVWMGTITITSYSDDEDTATDTFTITLFDDSDSTKYADWVEQKVQKAMANRESTDISVVNLFEKDETVADFTTRLHLYSLDYLNIMADMATSAITVMTEQGIATNDVSVADVYSSLYKPYYDKSVAIQNEIATREQELAYIMQPTDEDGNTDARYPDKGLIDYILEQQDVIRDALDLQTYLGDEDWTELSFYRREDQYQNSNFISDGLTDAEIIEQAERFYEAAHKEIIKASTIQHVISASLKDLLLIPEFFGLQNKFKSGNWIRLRVDDTIYKLRMTNWTVDWDDIEELDVEFSDVVRYGNIVDDVESILSKSKSIATNYDFTAKQAGDGEVASETIKIYRDYGIDFSKVKAIVAKGNTNIVYDNDGILLKRTDGVADLPEQARIYNNGIYITKDAWETVSTGLGHFSYIDPETQETVDTYGIIADTVIGKLILGDELKIYSQDAKLEMGGDGLVITAKDGEDNTDLFTVQKEVTDGDTTTIEKYIYVDSDGNVRINGSSVILSGTQTIDDALDDARKVATNYLSVDNTGVMVADMTNGAQTPSGITSGNNVFIDSDSVNIRDGQNTLATFGANGIQLGDSIDGNFMVLDEDSLDINHGSTKIAHFGYDEGNAENGTETTPYYTLGIRQTATSEYSSSSTYAVGDQVLYNGVEYVCITDITTAEAWTRDHWQLLVGNYSTAEGKNTMASGFCSHSEGLVSAAVGVASHAEGCLTKAKAVYSHCEGWMSEVGNRAYCGHAEGCGTKAIGSYSHAEGYDTTARGESSHAQNENTTAFRRSQTVIGEYNIVDTYVDSDEENVNPFSCRGKYVFIIGNGRITAFSNALTVDWNGNLDIAGGIYIPTNKYISLANDSDYTTLPSTNNQKNLIYTDEYGDGMNTYYCAQNYHAFYTGGSGRAYIFDDKINSSVPINAPNGFGTATQQLSITRVNNSYFDATAISRLSAWKRSGILFIVGNLAFTTSMPTNTEVTVAKINGWSAVSGIIQTVAGQNNSAPVNINVKSDGNITVGNYSGTTAGNWHRFAMSIPSTS